MYSNFKIMYTMVSCFDNTKCYNINDIPIITVKNVDYRCIIHKISKSERINLLKNYVSEDRG